MSELSIYGENIIGSEILKISTKIKENKEKIYNYTIGDFDSQLYPIPVKFSESIEWNFRINNTNYPMGVGEIHLREKVSKHLQRKHNIQYSTNQILIGAGVRPLIYTIFKTIINKGDGVIFPTPSWNNNHYTFLHDGNQIVIDCKPENDFFPTAEQIKSEIKNAKLICLCSPQNPTGKVINPNVLKDICNVVLEENKRRLEQTNDYKPIYIFFDQIYSDLSRIETHHPINLVPEIKDFLVCVDGISKSFSATGVRIGWMFGPEKLIKKAGEIFSHIGAWANKPEQYALSTYLGNENDVDRFLSERNKIFGIISDNICNTIQNMKYSGYNVDYKKPDGAIYISLYLGYYTKFNDIEEMINYLINTCKVGLVPFEYFGSKENKGWFRLSIGTINLNQITEHQKVIENMIKNLDNY